MMHEPADPFHSCLFDIGDIVELRSGGFPMTVTANSENWVECSWHAADGEARSVRYPAKALRDVSGRELGHHHIGFGETASRIRTAGTEND